MEVINDVSLIQTRDYIHINKNTNKTLIVNLFLVFAANCRYS